MTDPVVRIFFALALMYFVSDLMSCNHAKAEEATAPIRLAWEGKHSEARIWSQHLVKTLTVSRLPSEIPSDIKEFCPKYPQLGEVDRIEVWAQLLSKMTERESKFNPKAFMYECNKSKNVYGKNARYDSKRGWCMTGGHKDDGGYVISRGLLQMSLATAKSYGCDIQSASDLHDAKKNLSCAHTIMVKWVRDDKRLAGKVGTKWRGGARYWSVLRAKSRSYPVVREYMRSLKVCN